jgi:hypothetical protein
LVPGISGDNPHGLYEKPDNRIGHSAGWSEKTIKSCLQVRLSGHIALSAVYFLIEIAADRCSYAPPRN